MSTSEKISNRTRNDFTQQESKEEMESTRETKNKKSRIEKPEDRGGGGIKL